MSDTANHAAGGHLVLVVEDNPRIRAYIGAVLQSAGIQVLEAADGLEALDVFQDWHDAIDLVVTDIRMPRMTGTELAAWLRVVSPALPLIFVSGEPAPDGLHRHGNGWFFIEKPFDPEVLLDAARRLFDWAPVAA